MTRCCVLLLAICIAVPPALGGDFLQPLYFQRCVQDATTRVFVCTMLSGETAYTSTFTPIDEAM